MPNYQPRALGLAIGAGPLIAGLVMALLGLVLGAKFVGLVAAGMVIAAIGLVVALVGAIGFARHGYLWLTANSPSSSGRRVATVGDQPLGLVHIRLPAR